MSVESAKLFIEKMNTNLVFRQIAMGYEDSKLFMEFIAKEGYEFTNKELKDANQGLGESFDQEMSDKELSTVAGGMVMQDMSYIDYTRSALSTILISP